MIYIFLFLILLIIDQYSKFIVDSTLSVGETVPVIEKTLENNFWKVSVVSNKDTSSPSLKSNFVITCESLYADYLGTYQGIIKFSDLRTGKRIAVYKFKVSTKSAIIENIIKTMDSIPGASSPASSITVTKPVK